MTDKHLTQDEWIKTGFVLDFLDMQDIVVSTWSVDGGVMKVCINGVFGHTVVYLSLDGVEPEFILPNGFKSMTNESFAEAIEIGTSSPSTI